MNTLLSGQDDFAQKHLNSTPNEFLVKLVGRDINLCHLREGLMALLFTDTIEFGPESDDDLLSLHVAIQHFKPYLLQEEQEEWFHQTRFAIWDVVRAVTLKEQLPQIARALIGFLASDISDPKLLREDLIFKELLSKLKGRK